uniref:Uncharacterized protein n=1 Tax=Anguilla anguilla TaxID=7936 RepID=A0A0E9SGH3_ANGAN
MIISICQRLHRRGIMRLCHFAQSIGRPLKSSRRCLGIAETAHKPTVPLDQLPEDGADYAGRISRRLSRNIEPLK